MRVFPLTLIDGAEGWLNLLPPNSIFDWQTLHTKFLEKFFPVSKRLEIEEKIQSFAQQERESYETCWERFNTILRENLVHGFTTSQLCTRFFGSLNDNAKNAVMNVHQWRFFEFNGDEAWQALDKVATLNREMGMNSRAP